MNRTDRLYALVEQMRAVAPQPVSVRRLAERFEVSLRTIERDISALQQSGVPIWAEQGRRGGYVLDRETSLPPINFTAAEATALAVTLTQVSDGAFASSARSALQKVLAAMPARDAAIARALASRVWIVEPARGQTPMPRVPSALSAAVASGRCVHLRYADRDGEETERVIEPMLLLGGSNGWYVIGWCRLRDAGRAFRLDRIRGVDLLQDRVVLRELDAVMPPMHDLELRSVDLF